MNSIRFILALVLFVPAVSLKGQVKVVPPGSMVEGRTIPEWTAEWWKWLLAVPTKENPWFDETGELALKGQPDEKVLFLVGVVNSGMANRSITIPADRYLFFPILNLLANSVGEDPWLTITEELRDGALEYADQTLGLELTVDGVPATGLLYTTGEQVEDLYAHLELSPEFAAWLPPTNNIFQYFGFELSGFVDPCFSSGHWIMLTPLPPGEHVINFKGGYGSATQFSLDVTYNITVEPFDLAAAVEQLLRRLDELPNSTRIRLSRPLELAANAFRNARFQPAVHHLKRFQVEVRQYVADRDSSLAEELIAAAQEIIDASVASSADDRLLSIGPRKPDEALQAHAGPSQFGGRSNDSLPAGAVSPLLPSTEPREDFWFPDGPVHAILATNGVVYIGGDFESVSRANTPTSGGFDRFSGSLDPDLPAINGAVHAIAPDGRGGWFVGGQFTLVDGQPRSNLVRLMPDKTVDPNWRADTDAVALALETKDDTLYVGGSFTLIGGLSRNHLAAVQSIDGQVTDWDPDVSVTSPIKLHPIGVRALAVTRDLVYVAGSFNSIGGLPRQNLGAVDPVSGQVTDWNPIGFEFVEDGQVIDALAVSGDVVYVGSSAMRSINLIPRRFAAAFDATVSTNNLLPWNPNPDGPVLALAAACDTIYVGGDFTSVGGQARSRLAAVDPAVGMVTGWNPGADGRVQSLLRVGRTLYAGGAFTEVAGLARPRLAALDTTSGQPTFWQPEPAFKVFTVALAGNLVFAGGENAGIPRRNLVAIDLRTGKPTDWQPDPDGSVYAMDFTGDALYLGGDFTSVGGQSRNRLAAVSPITGRATEWNPNVTGFERRKGIVERIVVSGNNVYVAGSFTNIDHQIRNHLAALDMKTGKLRNWQPSANDDVRALLASGNTIFAGGRFTHIGGESRRRIAALHRQSGKLMDWGPEANDAVRDLVMSEAGILAGGLFSEIGGVSRGRFAAIDPWTGRVASSTPRVSNTNKLGDFERTSYINTIKPVGPIVYLGGLFNEVGGVASANLSAVDSTTWADLPWNPKVDFPVIALAEAEGSVLAGGVFKTVGGQFRPHLAVFPPEGAPAITQQPRSQRVAEGEEVSFQAAASGDPTLAYQWQFDGTKVPGATSSTLTIASAQVSDSGEYTLVVTNTLGLIHSRPARLTVLRPLKIVSQPVSQTVAPGSTVMLSVAVAGHPPPIYQWRLNGVNIPGAINPAYTITNAQPADGGSYQVVVANLGGAISSEIATVVVSSPALEFADDFASRGMLSGAAGVGSGSNGGATQEVGEPEHAGKVGGRSVWVNWTAPASGIAIFNTRGSSFDTLLAVYTGTNVTGLNKVFADEDRGGFLTSRAAFNAEAGVEYAIAVDGFGGAEGNIVLSWSLDTAILDYPQILNEPVGQTVKVGQTATFTVYVSSHAATHFQWYRACRAIAGATDATLQISNVQLADVDDYRVVVWNDAAIAESVPVALEIGLQTDVLTRDKIEDVLNPAALSGKAGGFISVAFGSVVDHTGDNGVATTSLRETNHCGVLGGASVWLKCQPQRDGMMVVDTFGSAIDTVLAVYRDTDNPAYFYDGIVACDDNSGPDGISSLVRFDAWAGEFYWVAADGVGGDKGTIKFNWRLGVPPPSWQGPPLRPIVRPGQGINLTVSAPGGDPKPSYQWYFNGALIFGATNAWLTLSNLQGADAGIYSVLASNLVGMAWETNAVVTVVQPLELRDVVLTPEGQFSFTVYGPTGLVFSVETTTELNGTPVWIPLRTNELTGSAFHFVETNAVIHQGRFYRAVVVP